MSYIKKLLILFFLFTFAFWSGKFMAPVFANEDVTICHATDADNNPYVKQSPNIQNDGSLAGGHLNHTGPVWPDKVNGKWGDIIPPYDHGNFHYPGLNWTDVGRAIWLNDCDTPVKTVQINHIGLACGVGERTFTGTANFQEATKDHLVVKLDNNIVVHRHDEPSTWSFSANVGLGSHKIEAFIYDDPGTDNNNHTQAHSDKDAEAVWEFTIDACVVDICPLLDGVADPTIQTEIPSGYHKDNPEDRNCVKDQTQSSPTPAPTPEPTNPPAGGPPGPPQCGAQKPPKPGTLTAEKTSPTTVKLTWSAVTPVTYYAISYGTDPNNFQFGVPNAGNTTSFVVGALNPNLKYYFKVIAVNDCMPSDPSAVVSPGGVLGASTEKVLGANTDRLAATDSNLYLPRTMVAMVFFVLSLTSGVKFLHGWKKS